MLSLTDSGERLKLAKELARLKGDLKNEYIAEKIGESNYDLSSSRFFKPFIQSQSDQTNKLGNLQEQVLTKMDSMNMNQLSLVDSLGEKLRSIGYTNLPAIEAKKHLSLKRKLQLK